MDEAMNTLHRLATDYLNTPEDVHVDLARYGQLRRALVAAIEEVEAEIRARLPEYAADGVSQQRMAELAGMSIQTVRKIVVPGAAERNAAWQEKLRQAGRNVLGPKPGRGKDAGPRMKRGAHDADAFSGPTREPERVVVTDDATEAFIAAARGDA